MAAVPITVDIDNNNVVISSTIVSDQLYRDHYQLDARPNTIAMLIGGGCWVTNQDFLVLRTAAPQNIIPLTVPALSETPIAYLGRFYTDGAACYYCTNGSTWTELYHE